MPRFSQEGPSKDRLPGPIRGISDFTAIVDQPGDLCPPDAMLNAWPFDTGKDGLRIGKRPGLVPALFDAAGRPWKAPSYIQGMAKIDIPESQRLEYGQDTFDLLDPDDGGAIPYGGFASDYNHVLLNNVDFQGTGATPPPVVADLDYISAIGTDAIAEPESLNLAPATDPNLTPESISPPVSRWDKYAADAVADATYGKDMHIACYNVRQGESSGKLIGRVRLVSTMKNQDTGKWEFVSEIELSDCDLTSSRSAASQECPLYGTLDLFQAGDALKTWHLFANDIDIGPDFVYVAVLARQTTDGNSTGTEHAARGLVFAIPKEFFKTGSSRDYSEIVADDVSEWAAECVAVRYRNSFTPVTEEGITYGSPDVLVAFNGYKDFWSGIARYSPTLASRLRIGQKPVWFNYGHGPLKNSFEGQTQTQLNTAGANALVDGDHGYCRIAAVTRIQRGFKGVDTNQFDRTNDMNVRWALGCYISDMDVDSSGRIFIIRSSIGWGIPTTDASDNYTATYSNNNLPSENRPRVSVMGITPTGRLEFEVDTITRSPSGGYMADGGAYGPYFNDRYNPTLICVTADQNGGCLAVGRWSSGKNAWHCRKASDNVGTVDWSIGIGIVSGQVEDSSDQTTRPDPFDGNETIGIGELTLLYCAYSERDQQYIVCGESFRPFSIGSLGSGTPSAGQWRLPSTQQATAELYGPASSWKLNSSGQMIWKHYTRSNVATFNAEMYRPISSAGNGSLVMLVSQQVNSTTRDSGSSSASANIGWSWSSLGGYWWLSNPAPDAVRHVAVFDRSLGSSEEIRLTFRKRIHDCSIVVKSDESGKNCYEVGIDSGGPLLFIRKVIDGVVQSNDDSVDPTTTDGGLTSDEMSYDIRVRVRGTVIQGFLSTQVDQETPLVEAEIDDYFQYSRFGFSSSFQTSDADGNDGTASTEDQIVRVSGAIVATLVPRVVTASSVLAIVSGGRFFVVRSGSVVEEISGLNMNPYGLASLAAYNLGMHIVDGKKWMKWDPSEIPASSLSAFVPDSGSLPGATPDGVGGYLPGTTTATNLVVHIARLWAYGMPEDRKNMVGSASGDDAAWDQDEDSDYASTTLSTEIAGILGSNITGAFAHNDDVMIIGCQDQIWVISGDPAIDGSRNMNVTRDEGCLTAQSISFNSSGMAMAITTGGAGMIAGRQIKLSSIDRLRKYNVPSTHATPVHTVAAYDGVNKAFMCFYTPVDSENFSKDDPGYYQSVSARGVHLMYSERVNGYFPMTFPSGADPICCIKYDNSLLMGCKDGYVRKFGEYADKQDWGNGAYENFRCTFPSAQILAADASHGVLLQESVITLSKNSDGCTLRLQGAATPEDVYDLAASAGSAIQLSAGKNVVRQRMRGGVVVMRFLNESNQTFAVDHLSVGIRDVSVQANPVADNPPPVTPEMVVCEESGASSGSSGGSSGSASGSSSFTSGTAGSGDPSGPSIGSKGSISEA